MADYDNIITTGRNTFRVERVDPSAYRLVRRGGELLLQGRFDWTDGKQAGFDWKDIPTVVESQPAPADPTPNRPPLWEVMDAARYLALHDGCNNGFAVAAEIRALVEARLPEEPLPLISEPDWHEHEKWSRLMERQRLRQQLLADADEAEAGQ
jgi:hypothetical protein